MDAVCELIERSQKHPELEAFHEFHKQHPFILDFLVQEIRLRLERFRAFSFHSLWDYARWKLELERGPGNTFKMNDHLAPFYGRAILILHPEFNGRAELRKCRADAIFGTCIEPDSKKRPKDYSRKLAWEDGTPLERGWRPKNPHIVTHSPNLKPDIHERVRS